MHKNGQKTPNLRHLPASRKNGLIEEPTYGKFFVFFPVLHKSTRGGPPGPGPHTNTAKKTFHFVNFSKLPREWTVKNVVFANSYLLPENYRCFAWGGICVHNFRHFFRPLVLQIFWGVENVQKVRHFFFFP